MFPLPIPPAQPVLPGATVDAPAGDPNKPSPETFASLLFLLIPGSQPAAKILAVGETPAHEISPETGAEQEITDKDLPILAALFTVVPPAQLPPESGRELALVENASAQPPAPATPQPILSFATGQLADQLGDAADSGVIPENLPSTERTTLPQRFFDVKNESIGRQTRVSDETPTLSFADARPGEAEKIPAAFRDLFEKSGAAEKKAVEDSQTAAPLAHQRETAATDAAPRGLSIADVQVDQHVEGASLLPSERSGFFSHDNNRGGDHDAHAGTTANQQPFAHGVTFQPVEAERTAAPAQNHSWSATIERLATEISAQARSERQEISMRLEPPELGHVKIELALDGDRLQARVTTEFAEAGALIQNHVQELRQALQAHSLDLVSIQVDLGGTGGFFSNLQQDAESGQKSSPEIRGGMPASDGEAGEVQRVASLDRGGVSVWA